MCVTSQGDGEQDNTEAGKARRGDPLVKPGISIRSGSPG